MNDTNSTRSLSPMLKWLRREILIKGVPILSREQISQLAILNDDAAIVWLKDNAPTNWKWRFI